MCVDLKMNDSKFVLICVSTLKSYRSDFNRSHRTVDQKIWKSFKLGINYRFWHVSMSQYS